jgi:hypothetical protein
MGLLDDAIRDHLELKRRRGADPSEVAREQREALNTAEEPLEDADFAPRAGAETVATPEPTVVAPEAAGLDDHIAGETAELDMRTVLGAEDGDPAPGADDDSLDWEMPERGRSAREAAARPVAEGAEPTDATIDEPVDDVLEETPEFLRDTPEQERMWFEQRPPRDFDFDK